MGAVTRGAVCEKGVVGMAKEVGRGKRGGGKREVHQRVSIHTDTDTHTQKRECKNNKQQVWLTAQLPTHASFCTCARACVWCVSLIQKQFESHST